MAIETRRSPNNSRVSIVMVECPLCGAAIPDGKGFSYHWPNCGENDE